MIRVLLAEDHAVVRAGLAQLLDRAGDIEVVGAAADGAEAVELTGAHAPDVILMDLSMPVMDGLAATEALRAARPEARVIVLTAEGTDARGKAMLAGAHALVPKGTRLEALLRCLRTVAAGGTGCPYCL